MVTHLISYGLMLNIVFRSL